MRVLCAWCVKEGKPALIGEREPREDLTETHGICPEHRAAVEAEVTAWRKEADALRARSESLQEKVDP